MRRGERIAQRYARALFGLGAEGIDPEGLVGELTQLLDAAAESAPLRQALLTPIHPRNERRALIGDLARRLGLSREVVSFAMLLVEENRTSLLPQIRDGLRTMVEEAAGRVHARVVSARELSDAEVQRLRGALARRIQGEISIELAVDPALLGGAVVRAGDLLLDGSVRTRLAALRGSLERESR
jgi:F-type H+-transporting ATPase subunit delta